MTAEDFRKIALSFPEAAEQAHMNHPDFRVRGKVFATLGYPDASFAMVQLTPELQHELMKAHAEVFSAAKGAWGLRGSTVVKLKAAKKTVIRAALAAAWRKAAPKSLSDSAS